LSATSTPPPTQGLNLDPSRDGSRLERLPRLRVGQWLGLTIGVLLAFAVVGVGLALLANHKLSNQRSVVLGQVEPALLAALKLENALINEETGVRGYLLSGKAQSLEPYEKGLHAEASAYRGLKWKGNLGGRALSTDVSAVRTRTQAWQTQFVMPIMLSIRAGHTGSVPPTLSGKGLFDAIRTALARLRGDLSARLISARQQLNVDANFLQIALIVATALILGSLLGAGFLLRRSITRPLAELGKDAAQVGSGDFAKPVSIGGAPREIVELGDEIDAMRQRIVQELITVESAKAALESQALELNRSNAELEQFAYVASHDLQEPLRKIASFCQALERRYHGQLDERADQYIEFAVDGAKRMQTLINDLLAFSRVGRSGRPHELVDLNEAANEAQASLSNAIEDAGAHVVVEPLPSVRGERALLVSLFQNLIANALKFRRDEPPAIRVSVTADESQGQWQFSCTDNGIGVDPEYAERIFVIFQRLHTKETFPGTGIGLAMCRKIVEYHDGRMWLDPSHTSGAQFRFTLPIAPVVDAPQAESPAIKTPQQESQ
jgi:signal transduction histidine kinase